MTGRDLLRKQLELVRFEKAIDYVAGAAGSRKHLNSQELASINSILTNVAEAPWRQEPATVKLPGGRTETLALLNNPVFACRDLLASAIQRAREGEVEAAAAQCYAQLVQGHFFRDANRRTAVAAAHWILLENGIEISPLGLLETGVGDLKMPSARKALEDLVRASVQIARERGRKS